jgi:hypothetical protein
MPISFPRVFREKAKMKTAIIASLVASAAAFAPSKDAGRTSVATNMGFESELGAQPPFGFFDPLGLVADGDQAKFDRLRYVEIKHGRICMLGVVGYLLTDGGTRLPGLIASSGTKFTDIPSGFDALGAIPSVGLAQIIAFIGFLELSVMKSLPGTGNEFVGDFRNGYLDFGWDLLSEEAKLNTKVVLPRWVSLDSWSTRSWV